MNPMLFWNSSFFSSRIFALLTLLIWMGVIFSFSMLSGKLTSATPPLWYFIERKGAHVAEYAILMLLAFRFFRLSFLQETTVRVLSLSAVFALMYAATDELHQFFVPLRGARMTDVLIDGGGILLAAAILFFMTRKNRP